jgi:hypothetical protein
MKSAWNETSTDKNFVVEEGGGEVPLKRGI